MYFVKFVKSLFLCKIIYSYVINELTTNNFDNLIY